MVEALDAAGEPTQTIKTGAALARVDDLAQSLGSQEIRFLKVGSEGQRGSAAVGGASMPNGTNLFGQAYLDNMATLAALDQVQSTVLEEAAQRLARWRLGEAGTTSEPGDGEAEAEPAFETTVAQEMRIDGTVDDGEAQLGDEIVFELFPDLCGVGYFDFHGLFLWKFRQGPRQGRGRRDLRLRVDR